MGTQFAKIESKLGETDRARAIFMHISEYCNPGIETPFWNTWNEFEIYHGTKETFQDMMRVKRTIQIKYNGANPFDTS